MKCLFRLLCLLLASTAFAQNTYLKSTSGYKIFSQGIASSNEYVYQAISHSGFLQFSDDSTFSYQSDIIFDLKVKTLISQCLFNGVNIENLEIENFNLNKNQNSVDFYVIENEIYLFGWPTDNTLIIGHKIIEVNGSNPILIKLNEHLEYVGHHSLQNSFNGIKLRLVKNQNELFITAFTAIDYDFQPYFAKSEPAFVILKMDNNLTFQPYTLKLNSETGLNFDFRMDRVEFGYFGYFNYSDSTLNTFKLETKDISIYKTYEFDGFNQVSDVSIDTKGEIVFTILEKDSPSFKIEGVYKSPDSSAQTISLYFIDNNDKVVRKPLTEKNKEAGIWGELFFNGESHLFIANISSFRYSDRSVPSVRETFHNYYSFAVFDLNKEIKQLAVLYNLNDHFHPEKVHTIDSNAYVVYGYSDNNFIDIDSSIFPDGLLTPKNHVFFYIINFESLSLDTNKFLIYIPNAFHPNGDLINDKWTILSNHDSFAVSIFERSGTCVYQSEGNSIEWDGTFKGKPCPSGNYYAVVKAFLEDKTVVYNQVIYLIR